MATQETLIDKSFQVMDKIEGKRKEQQKVPTGFFAIFKLRYWRQYFDFPSSEIITRFQSSLIHYPQFTEVMHEQPDLYGPFWIYTTIILFIAVSGNLNSYFDYAISDSNKKYSFNYNFIPKATTLTICLYGYSMACLHNCNSPLHSTV